MKKLILILIFLCLISSVSASVYQKGNNIDLKVPCINSGAYCSSSTTCNLTTIYPNETILLNNLEMTNQVSFHNYTLNASDINVIGEYKNIVMCTDGIYNGTSTFIIDVTLSGNSEPGEKSFILAGIFIVIFGIACVFLFLSSKMTEVGPKIFFLLGSFVFLLGSMGIIAIVSFDANLSLGINETIGHILFALGMVFYILFGYIMIKETATILDLYREKKYFGTDAY